MVVKAREAQDNFFATNCMRIYGASEYMNENSSDSIFKPTTLEILDGIITSTEASQEDLKREEIIRNDIKRMKKDLGKSSTGDKIE